MNLNHIKGIYYIGQYGTSGYASAAKGYLYHFHKAGIPITWEPLYFDTSEMENDEYTYDIKKLINNQIMYDTVILHCTPDLWSIFRKDRPHLFKNKLVIGYCAWESELLMEDWVKSINESVNEVWVPSTYNKKIFINNGVKINIRVVPHIFLKYKLPQKNNVIFNNDDLYTFYTISELNERKNLNGVIKSFCEEFNKNDNVRLLIKTFYKNYNKPNKLKCKQFLTEMIKTNGGGDKNIEVFLNHMTSHQINELHSVGDCYVSLSRSEGFGLSIYEAYNYGKKVIATGYGGHIDYLGNNYSGLVEYKMTEITNMYNYSGHSNIKHNLWADPDIKHTKKLMRKSYTEWKNNS